MLVILLLVVYFNVKRVRKFISVIFKINDKKDEYKTDGKLTEWFVGSTDEGDRDENKCSDGDEENGNREEMHNSTIVSQDRRQGLERDESEYIEGPSIGLYIVGKYCIRH